MQDDAGLTARPPKPHGTNAELVVFEMMADIEALIRRRIGHSFIHDSWPILQALLRAHVTGCRVSLADLWMAADQPLEKTLDCVERLATRGLIECDPGVAMGRADGPVSLTPAGAACAEALAEGIVETLTSACSRAGLDPFARPVARRAGRRVREADPVA
jgi:hypothetical protein